MLKKLGAAGLLSLFFANGTAWAGACDEKCRNADFFLSGNFFHAVKKPAPGSEIEFFQNGLSNFIPQPGGAAFNVPALRNFGGKLFLVVRGADGDATPLGGTYLGYKPFILGNSGNLLFMSSVDANGDGDPDNQGIFATRAPVS